MPQVSATHFSRHLKDYLDRVERGESFTIMRHGRKVASIGPSQHGNGRAVKEALRAFPPDPTMADDIEDAMRFIDQRIRDPWND